MQIIETKPLTWQFYVPENFPCHVCEKKRAKVKAKFRAEDINITLCLCYACLAKPIPELEAWIFPKKFKDLEEANNEKR